MADDSSPIWTDFNNARRTRFYIAIGFGAPVHVRFHPKIPLGSKILGATVGGRNAAVTLDHNEQDEHASMEFDAPAGTTEVAVRFSGSVAIAVPLRTPPLGDPSTGLKLVSEWLSGNELRVAADTIGGADNSFRIRTTREIASADGAKIERIAGDQYRVLLDRSSHSGHYERRTIVINLAQ